MPKAAVYEYDGHSSGKDQIGRPRQVLSVKPEAISEGVSDPADHKLGDSVLAPNARHQP